MKERIIRLAYVLLGRKLADRLLMKYMDLRVTNKQVKKLVKQNKKFHDSHVGERCFIVSA